MPTKRAKIIVRPRADGIAKPIPIRCVAPSSEATRKERNKFSAAKSRANRKAMYEQMQQTIEGLRLENAALTVQVASLAAHISTLNAQQGIEACPWDQFGIKFDEPRLDPTPPVHIDDHSSEVTVIDSSFEDFDF